MGVVPAAPALTKLGERWTRRRPAVRALAVLRVALGYAGLLALSAVFIVPFLWMVASSLKTEGDVFLFPPTLVSDPIQWQNYPAVFAAMPFGIFALNSFKISILSTVGTVLTASLAAYAFARLHFPGRNALFLVLLATMMIPDQVTLIPQFILMRFVGWTDSHNALIVPRFLGSAFGTFLLRQFFLTIPDELEDAALVDGAGRLAIYWQIFLPLAKPALATLAVFTFMGVWNDLTGPIIYLSSKNQMTLTVGLTMFRGVHQTHWHWLMAGTVITIMPILVIYAAAQKYFVQGITMTGIKG
jgi:multiple sugar transport system permease protein